MIGQTISHGELTKDQFRTQAALGHLYAVSGDRENALGILQQVVIVIPSRIDLTFGVALIYAGLGETDKAFEWLDKAYENRSGTWGTIRTDPKLDGLRSDPRFSLILKKMGLLINS